MLSQLLMESTTDVCSLTGVQAQCLNTEPVKMGTQQAGSDREEDEWRGAGCSMQMTSLATT